MTFKDLKFKPHPLAPMFSEQAKHNFPNGYGVSVINGVMLIVMLILTKLLS